MQQEVLTVKFDGQGHQVEVQTFAYSVLNFSTVVKEVNKGIDGTPLDIHIKAPSKGSVLVELVTTITNNAQLIPPHIELLANIIEVTGGCYALHKFISGKKVEQTDQSNGGSVTIHLDDGSQMTVAENVYNIYTTVPAVPNGMSQHFSALNDDPAVTSFEIKRQSGETFVEAERKDFARLAIKQQFETANSRTTVESAILYIYKMVFDRTDRKWEFYHSGNRISASITDDDFYKLIDQGESFAKGDQLKVDLQVNQILDESVGIFVNQSYCVVKVYEHIKRSEPLKLPFETD